MIATSTTLKPARGRGRKAYVPKNEAPKTGRRRESNDSLFRRLRLYLSQLQKIDKSLPREVWQRFIAAYAQHWLYSVNHGETATAPAIFYNEWAEAQAKGSIPMDTSTDHFHSARRYHVYESPRETARRVLGFED